MQIIPVPISPAGAEIKDVKP